MASPRRGSVQRPSSSVAVTEIIAGSNDFWFEKLPEPGTEPELEIAPAADPGDAEGEGGEGGDADG